MYEKLKAVIANIFQLLALFSNHWVLSLKISISRPQLAPTYTLQYIAMRNLKQFARVARNYCLIGAPRAKEVTRWNVDN